MITPDDIRLLFDSSITTSDKSIQSFIDTATTLVTNAYAKANVTVDITVQEEVEKYVAAHLLASLRERMAQKEGAGGAEITYMGISGKGFDSTPYGQMALVIDTTGILRTLEGKRLISKAIKTPNYGLNYGYNRYIKVFE